MGQTKIEVVNAGAYDYCKVAKTLEWDDESLGELQEQLQQSHGQGKKMVLGLHPSLTIEAHRCPVFLQFLQEELTGQLVIAPQKQKLEWGAGWKELLRRGIPVMELSKAMEVAGGGKMSPRHQCFKLGDTTYVKSTGDICLQPATWNSLVGKVMAEARLPAQLLPEPVQAESQTGLVWNQLQGGVVFDVAEVTRLDSKWTDALRRVLPQQKGIDKPGFYFITSSVFQRWLLAELLELEEIPEYGNILRVVDSLSIGEAEGPALVKAGQQKVPPLNFLVHYAIPDQALNALQQFYAEVILTDQIETAKALQKKAPANSKKRIASLMQSVDPQVKILGPEMMMKGCAPSVFAEFLVSRYQNNHGYPNDTYVYCMDTDAASLQKVAQLLQSDFPQFLQQFHYDLFSQLVQYQVAAGKQGHFLFSLLKEEVVNLEISLPLTPAGNAQLLQNYGKLFADHCHLLNDMLRIFIKASLAAADINVLLQPVQGINKVTVRQAGFLLEAKWQNQEFLLTIHTDADKETGSRCMALFTLLNGSPIFSRLPEKELFIELISLLWENFQSDSSGQQKFLVTLRVSPQATELKAFHNAKNKAALSESSQQDRQHVRLLCDSPYSVQGQKRLLKLLSLFFYAEPQQTEANAWKFACMEALSQAANKIMSGQVLSIDFMSEGESKKAVISSNAQQAQDIPARSRQTMESGADRLLVENNGRKITLLKKPLAEEAQQLPAPGELAIPDDAVISAEITAIPDVGQEKETAIPSTLEKMQAQEIKIERTQLMQIYKRALEKYEEKGASTEEATGRKSVDATEETIVRKPAHLTAIRAHKYERDVKVQKIYKRVGIGLAVITSLVAAVLVYAFNARIAVTEEARKRTVQQAPPDKPIKPQTQRVQYSGATKEGIAFLQKFVRVMALQAQQPSQNLFNALLKQIYIDGKAFVETPVVADLYNLQGRLYYYKVYFDQEEQLFDKNWKAAWHQEAVQAFTKAKESYAANKNKPFFNLPVLHWMPDQLYYKQALFVQYKTGQDAVKDMEKWLERLQNLKF